MEFIKNFIFLNLNSYENFGVDFPLGLFLVLLMAGICLASFYLNYYKSQTTALYKQLLRHGATSEEGAKTLGELRLSASRTLRLALSRGGELASIVKRAGEIKPTYEEYVEKSSKRGYKPEKINFEEARFYIEEGKTDKAKRLIEHSSPALWKPILLAIALAVLLVLMALFLPDLLALINKAAQ
jgi:hypothetical protein